MSDEDGDGIFYVATGEWEIRETSEGRVRAPLRWFEETRVEGKLVQRIEYRSIDGRIGPTRIYACAQRGDFLANQPDGVFERGVSSWRALSVGGLDPDTGDEVDEIDRFFSPDGWSTEKWGRALKAANAAQRQVRSGRGRPRTGRSQLEEAAQLYLAAEDGRRLSAVIDGQQISRAQASRRIRQARDLGLLPPTRKSQD